MLNNLTLLLTVFSMFFVFGVSESMAQEIILEPDSSENTYKTWNINGILDIQVRDAKDRGKALEGTHKLKYKCKKESEVVFSRDAAFTNGNSDRLRDICAKIIAEVIKMGEKIRLREGAGTNGFTVIKEGDSTYLKTNNVIDPATNKPLEGSQQIRVAVYPEYEPFGLSANHIFGNSETRFRRVLLQGIENPGNKFTDGIIIVSNSRNRSDDSSGGVDGSDSTNRGKQSSAISDDASVGNTSIPVRADSSSPIKNKTIARDKSSNVNRNSAGNGAEPKIVKLIKDGRKNGYKTWKKDGILYFQANNVFDPITKEPLDGLHDFSYRCGSGNELTRIKLKLSRGFTQRVAIACFNSRTENACAR